MRHWHTSAFDNSFNNTLSPAYTIAGTTDPGVYSFNMLTHSRAFNPSGSDAGFNADWHYNPVHNAHYPHIDITMVGKCS